MVPAHCLFGHAMLMRHAVHIAAVFHVMIIANNHGFCLRRGYVGRQSSECEGGGKENLLHMRSFQKGWPNGLGNAAMNADKGKKLHPMVYLFFITTI